MNQRLRTLTGVVTVAVLAVATHDANARVRHARAPSHASSHAQRAKPAHAAAKADHSRHAARAAVLSIPLPRPRPSIEAATPAAPAAPPTAATALSGDLAGVKQALDLVRKGKARDAAAVKAALGDPVAQMLVEWLILRHPDGTANFARTAAFITEHPNWPNVRLLRTRAEGLLWQEHSDAATVRRFTADQPLSGKGRLALARALLAAGDRDGAAQQARAVWRSQELSERLEGEAIAAFGPLLTADDHRLRMDRRIGAKDLAGAMRAARRLGGDAQAVVKACAAVSGGASNAAALIDAVATELRQDLGFVLCRAQWLMRKEQFAEAGKLMLAAPQREMAEQDTDQWWRERRVLARKLLDLGDAETAYGVVRDAAPPTNDNYRAEAHFMAGWIALRYRNAPATARAHFAHIDDGTRNPIVLARANYWRGRAAEALGDGDAMRTFFQAAAAHPTAYYGQIARARLGLDGLTLRPAPQAEPDMSPAPADDRVRAADMLYAIGERDLVLGFVSDLAEQSSNLATLSAFGELAARRSDARAMLEIGKTALARGLALDTYAFPDIGVPPHRPIGPDVERSLIFSVARTESAFDQRDVSPAKAVGLMQVTPEAGRDTAKRFGVAYDWNRLVSDPVYNTQMGAAELAALLREYRGCYIMTFAGYNAGRGRVQQWVKQYGDPRDPHVDAVDWVERIPFAETRNYVQRVMENLQVYRVRLGAGAAVAAQRQPDGATGEPSLLEALASVAR
ncbi:MAG: lytic transglycosylase domain-containing protein [Pseudomonadota bacterium]